MRKHSEARTDVRRRDPWKYALPAGGALALGAVGLGLMSRGGGNSLKAAKSAGSAAGSAAQGVNSLKAAKSAGSAAGSAAQGVKVLNESTQNIARHNAASKKALKQTARPAREEIAREMGLDVSDLDRMEADLARSWGITVSELRRREDAVRKAIFSNLGT